MSNHLRMEALTEPLATMVQCVLSQLSPLSTRAVHALVQNRGQFATADGFARLLGLRNRDQMRRLLASDRLPCLEDLAGWIRILGWTLEAEQSGTALSRGALCEGKDPRSRYRTVKRLTGKTWGEVRRCGSYWVLMQLATTLEAPKGVRISKSA